MKNLIHVNFKKIVFVLLLAFYASLITFKIPLPVAEDLARIIKNGEMVFHNHDVLTKNLYSYTEPNRFFTNHHWFSGVVFSVMQHTIGFSGMVIFKVLLLLASFSLVFWVARRKAEFWVVAFFSLPTIAIMAGRGMLRPEIFSYFFIALSLYLLTDLEEHPEHNRIYWLIPVQLLWVNMHLFFGVGVLLVLGFLFEKVVLNFRQILKSPMIKKLSLVLFGVVLACAVNPFGMKGAIFALRVNVLKEFPITIGENQSVFELFRREPKIDNIPVMVFEYMVPLLLLSFIFSFYRRKPIFYFLASLGTSLLGLFVVRSQSMFALIFLPAIAANFNPVYLKIKDRLHQKSPVVAKFVNNATVMLMVVVCAFFAIKGFSLIDRYTTFGIGLTPQANSSAEFFKANGLKGPIFNDTDIGSYLIYHLYPQEKVFVDNRFGDAYSVGFFNSVYLPIFDSEAEWQKRLDSFNFNVIYFYQYDHGTGIRSFLFRRVHDTQWVVVYTDIYTMILVRNNAHNTELINKYAITSDNVEEKLAPLANSPEQINQIVAADLYSLFSREDLAMGQYLKVVSRWPDKGKIWQIMGQIELSHDNRFDQLLAATFFERAIATGWNSPDVYSYLTLAYIKTGDLKRAREAWARVEKGNPGSEDSKRLLEMINAAEKATVQ
ncbi:MAG: hypothetical protein KW802_01970 [Candidatus Doudnabacteria bacterium]|nr:hypothetical protein [Candidatus Doudnabacteria bacterium]